MVKIATLVSILLALAGFLACGSSAPATTPKTSTDKAVEAPKATAAPAAAVEAKAVPGDPVLSAEIVIVTDTLQEEFDPTRLKANSDKRMHVFIFDALRNLGPKGHYPSLATGFKVSPDGLAIEWVLREGVKFQYA